MPAVQLGTPLFAVFASVLVLETLKTLFLGTATAFTRGRLKKFLNQEDAGWLGGEAVEIDDPRPARLMRAHRNNLENLLPFFIVGSLFVASGANAVAGMAYFTLFFLGRAAHTFAYLNMHAKLRRNAYSLAWLAIIATAVHALISILSTVL